jgi:GDP-L-fucose synthase
MVGAVSETPSTYALAGKKVWVAGHRGMVGAAILRRLRRENCEILTVPRNELDLCRQAEVDAWMAGARPEAILIAAAKVGGIHANATYPADFIHQNLAIQTSIIAAAHTFGVEKLMALGSACIYPRLAPQPMAETALLTGPLEPTNEAYTIAKIPAIKMCQAHHKQYGADFISALPNKLYGPGDDIDLEISHVIPAMIAKAHAAREAGAAEMVVWDSGAPLRELLYVDDLADAVVFLMQNYSGPVPVNIGSSKDVSIIERAKVVAKTVWHEGELQFDVSRPDGAPRKLLDAGFTQGLGWRATTPLADGLKRTYAAYLETI